MNTYGQYFEGVFCINLDRRKDRWDTFSEKLTADQWIAFDDKEDPNWGCTRTHMDIIREARQDGLESVLIFEDDATPVQEELPSLDGAMSDLKDRPWEMLYLGATYAWVSGPPVMVTENLFQVPRAYSTHAIAVHSRAYDYILEEGLKVRQAIDAFYQHTIEPRGQVYHLNPMAFYQASGFSDIQGRHMEYDGPGIFNQMMATIGEAK